MEKRKPVTLSGMLMRFIVFTGALVLGLALLWWSGLNFLMQRGVVYYAGAAESFATEGMQTMRAQGYFSPEAVPQLCEYAYFAADGQVLETSMDSRTLESAQRWYESGAPATGWGRVDFEDGSTCVLHWNYNVQFVDERLRSSLPVFEFMWLAILILAVALCVGLRTRALSKKLKTKLEQVSEVSRNIAAQNLDVKVPNTNVRELDEVMGAMDEMRLALKDSLQAQWSAEQQRTRQMQALAHDLKTPLTIIGGNAELLAEEELPENQARQVKQIWNSAAQAGRYLEALHATAQDGRQTEEKQTVEAEEFIRQVEELALPLAAAASCTLQVQNSGPAQLYIQAQNLQRALLNIIENAVRYSPKGGRVQMLLQSSAQESVEFVVRDEGPGFGPEALAHAAEPFWRQDAARGADGHYGLGLGIAAETAQRHGGALRLGNQPGGGAEVRLVLPQ